jgi:hypothetical protein
MFLLETGDIAIKNEKQSGCGTVILFGLDTGKRGGGDTGLRTAAALILARTPRKNQGQRDGENRKEPPAKKISPCFRGGGIGILPTEHAFFP